jgi:hypothetical protein
MTGNNHQAPIVEQIIIENDNEKSTQTDLKLIEQQTIQNLLNKFKQPIPNNFIQLETDYIFTTKSK